MNAKDKLQIISNWKTLEDQPLTKVSLQELFSNEIPCVRHKGFLSHEECERMVRIVQDTKFVCFSPFSVMLCSTYYPAE
jgi:hypothetical protein